MMNNKKKCVRCGYDSSCIVVVVVVVVPTAMATATACLLRLMPYDL